MGETKCGTAPKLLALTSSCMVAMLLGVNKSRFRSVRVDRS